jgi:hypothetical protein
MAGMSQDTQETQDVVFAHEENNFQKLTETIKGFANPFSTTDDSTSNTDLYNLVTTVVMSEKTDQELFVPTE